MNIYGNHQGYILHRKTTCKGGNIYYTLKGDGHYKGHVSHFRESSHEYLWYTLRGIGHYQVVSLH